MIETKTAADGIEEGRIYIPPIECVEKGCTAESRGDCDKCANRFEKWLVFDRKRKKARRTK